MHAYFSSAIAIYGAVMSTYTALKWLFESRPYLEIRKAPQSHAGSLLVMVHNPGRRPVFVVGGVPSRKQKGSNALLRIVPYRESGISVEEAASVLGGEIYLIIPPTGSGFLTIGPVYQDTNAVVILNWNRGWVVWPKLHGLWQRFINPLRVRINVTMVDNINTHGFLS